MLCTSLLNNSYLVSECQKLPGHILLFKDKTPLCFWEHFTHHAANGSVWKHTLKEMVTSTGIGTPTHGKNMKPPQINSFLHFLKEGISWLVWLVHPQATSLPNKRTGRALSLQHWFPQKGPVAGAKSAVSPAVGFGDMKRPHPFPPVKWVLRGLRDTKQTKLLAQCPSLNSGSNSHQAGCFHRAALSHVGKTLPNKLL